MLFFTWLTAWVGLAVASPKAIPAEFDCKVRELMLEYGVKIQPFRTKAAIQEMVDTLNMKGGEPGGAAQCHNLTLPPGLAVEFSPIFPPSKTAWFVDAESGNDSNDGSLQHPFQTVKRALAASRSFGKSEERSIVLRKGTHTVDDTIVLDARDSHLTLQNHNGEQVWLSGAKRTSASRLKRSWVKHERISGAWKLDTRGSGITEASALRINDRRAVRARFPNGCTSDDTMPSGYRCMGRPSKPNGVVSPLDGFGSNLIIDQARWIMPPLPTIPQENWYQYNSSSAPKRLSGTSYQEFNLGVGGTCDRLFTPPAGYWCGTGAWGGAPPPPLSFTRFPHGFNASGILPGWPFAKPDRVIVQAWHPFHWASWAFNVSGSKTNSTHLMFDTGGMQCARGVGDARAMEAFFVENAEELLDAENEFYFDEDSLELLYFGEKPSDDSLVTVPTFRTLIAVRGSQKDPLEGLSILGIGLRDTRMAIMDEHTMPAGGDWGLSLRAAVEIRGVKGLHIDACTFEDLDGAAIIVKGFARQVVIERNDFHRIGQNIIAQLGETEAPGLPADWGFGWNGTAGNQPRGSLIQNNFAYRCGLILKQSSFYFQSKSMQNVIKDNIFFHGPRAGINFNDGFGGGSVVEGNLLFATVIETGDHGPFNSWDRQPYASAFQNGEYIFREYNDTIKRNLFMGNYYAQEAVDNDDGSQSYLTHDNVFVYSEVGLKNDFNGHSNHHFSNIYAYLWRAAYDTGPWTLLKGHTDEFYDNTIVHRDSHGSYLIYDCKICAASGQSCPSLHGNKLYTPDGTISDSCDMSFTQRTASGFDHGSTIQRWPQPCEILRWIRIKLALPESHEPCISTQPSFLADM